MCGHGYIIIEYFFIELDADRLKLKYFILTVVEYSFIYRKNELVKVTVVDSFK